MSARQAASLIGDGMVVGASGFTRSGDSKAVLAALAEKIAPAIRQQGARLLEKK